MVKEGLSYDHDVLHITDNSRAGSRLAPSQWETALQSSTVSYWQGANSESALLFVRVSRYGVASVVIDVALMPVSMRVGQLVTFSLICYVCLNISFELFLNFSFHWSPATVFLEFIYIVSLVMNIQYVIESQHIWICKKKYHIADISSSDSLW